MPNTALQRTRRPRFRSGRSLRSLGSPLNAQPLGGFLLASGFVLSAIAQGGELPTPTSISLPHFPEVAIRARMEGRVELDVTVDGAGQVARVEILKTVNPLLDSAAVRALEQWKFKPAAGLLHVTVRYVLWREGPEYCLPGVLLVSPEMITVYGYPQPVITTTNSQAA